MENRSKKDVGITIKFSRELKARFEAAIASQGKSMAPVVRDLALAYCNLIDDNGRKPLQILELKKYCDTEDCDTKKRKRNRGNKGFERKIKEVVSGRKTVFKVV
jgi:hypothetical protein